MFKPTYSFKICHQRLLYVFPQAGKLTPSLVLTVFHTLALLPTSTSPLRTVADIPAVGVVVGARMTTYRDLSSSMLITAARVEVWAEAGCTRHTLLWGIRSLVAGDTRMRSCLLLTLTLCFPGRRVPALWWVKACYMVGLIATCSLAFTLQQDIIFKDLKYNAPPWVYWIKKIYTVLILLYKKGDHVIH